MITLKNLSKYYGSYLALDGISLNVKANAITALVGENGSGKSTLLNILGGLCENYQGSVHLNERDAKGIKAGDYAACVAILKQRNGSNLRLRVEEMVAFGRFPHCQGKLSAHDHLIVDEAMDFMNCLSIRDMFVDQLSGGQQQRVYIAMILAQDTDVMLLDEPLNNLDLKHAHELMTLIRRMVDERGKTVVLIMHDINMVYRYADRIIALKQGRLLCNGFVDDVLTASMLQKIYGMAFNVRWSDAQMFATVR